LLESAVKTKPDVNFITYIYSYYRHPARRERIEYPDNLLAGMVPSIVDDHEAYFSEWQKRGLKHFFLRPNFLCYGMAFYRGHERLIYDCFQIAYKYGAIGMDMDGGGGDYRQKDLESYVTTRMIAYPEKTFDEICSEFYAQYGAASNAVRTVREMIRASGEEAVRNGSSVRSAKGVLDDSMLAKYAVMGNTAKNLQQYVDILSTARSELENRLSAVERRRLDNEIIRFEHSLLSFRFREVGLRKSANQNELAKVAKELHDFRVKHKEAIGNQFSGIYGKRGGEAEIWKRAMPAVFK
jgi:hypothetical protein